MIRQLINLFVMDRDSQWYEKHPTIQARFEEIEDWLEEMEEALYELEQRTEELERMAHPKCGIEGFDGYEPLVKRIEKLEIVVGSIKRND